MMRHTPTVLHHMHRLMRKKNIIESVTLNGKTAEIKEKNVSINFIDFEEKEIVFAEVY